MIALSPSFFCLRQLMQDGPPVMGISCVFFLFFLVEVLIGS